MKKLIIVFVLLNVVLQIYSYNYAILPIEGIRLPQGYERIIYSAFSKGIINEGHEIVAYDKLNDVIETQKYNLSGLVNDKNMQFEVGNLLHVDYIVSVTFIWNGEYYLMDTQVVDVNTASVKFEKNYISNDKFESIVQLGINDVVNEIFGKSINSRIWNLTGNRTKLQYSEDIINWSRSLNRSNIVIAYNLSDDDIVLEYFNDIYDAGEYVFNFDVSRWRPVQYSFDNTHAIYEIVPYDKFVKQSDKYLIPALILKNPNTVVVYFGYESEIQKVISNLTRIERNYFWPIMSINYNSENHKYETAWNEHP